MDLFLETFRLKVFDPLLDLEALAKKMAPLKEPMLEMLLPGFQ
jgi:hypothetical protein